MKQLKVVLHRALIALLQPLQVTLSFQHMTLTMSTDRGNWDYYYDSYEPESETYDYADDWHQVCLYYPRIRFQVQEKVTFSNFPSIAVQQEVHYKQKQDEASGKGKAAALQLKMPFMFERFTFQFILVMVIHLCFASQAHSLPQVQPGAQKVHNMHYYRQSAGKELFPCPNSISRLTTETRTHNWHHPVSSIKFKYMIFRC